MSRESLERELLAEYPEEVGLVFLRVLVRGKAKFLAYEIEPASSTGSALREVARDAFP